MHEDEFRSQLKKLHESSFKGIIKNYGFQRLVRSFPLILSLLLTIASTIFLSLQKSDLHQINNELITLSLSIIPSLLGFSLGGFAIIVSFNDKDFLKKISRLSINTDSKKIQPSLFQKVIAVFAWGILMQSLTLIVTFLIKLFLTLQYPNPTGWPCLSSKILPLIQFVVLSFLLTYSLLLLPYIIKNVYGFGQITHPYSFKNTTPKDDKQP